MNNYNYELVTERIYRIIDPLGCCMYLVEGKDKCALIDTGNGVKGLKEIVEAITDKEVIVILSHGHLDHSGGVFEFEQFYLNMNDYQLFKKHSEMDFRLDYFKKKKIENAQDILIVSKEMKINPLNDLDKFDLGGITIEAVSVPGHTMGMMVFLIKEARVCIFGDVFGLMIEENSPKIFDIKNNLIKLKQFEEQYDLVLRNHQNYVSDKSILDNEIEICDLILSNKDDRCPMNPVLKERYNLQNEQCDFFVAKKTINGVREDGKEGNMTYRSDKI